MKYEPKLFPSFSPECLDGYEASAMHTELDIVHGSCHANLFYFELYAGLTKIH
jgi:hypothetical protein